MNCKKIYYFFQFHRLRKYVHIDLDCFNKFDILNDLDVPVDRGSIKLFFN